MRDLENKAKTDGILVIFGIIAVLILFTTVAVKTNREVLSDVAPMPKETVTDTTDSFEDIYYE